MKNLEKQIYSIKNGGEAHSRSVLDAFFVDSLEEMYYSENAISTEFIDIQDHIASPTLLAILKIHYAIHLKHKERLEKVFLLIDKPIANKTCEPLKALLAEATSHLSVFSNDIVNWEIALILVSQKLAHYKIASYGGLAHLAINLNYHSAATLLAISVQEEEEFIAHHLNSIFDAFLASHVEGYKSELN